MQVNGFIFDYAKCVGCHACLVACYIENGTNPPISWRQVSTYNSKRIPLAGYIYLSIACNHCIEAPCLKACPAKAYAKDDMTGAIIHFNDKCIGCKYCTWACPFDAPKYNIGDGVVEKCNLCNHRIIDGLTPACANNCPTGALSYGLFEQNFEIKSKGITDTDILPKIKTSGSNIIDSIPQICLDSSGFDADQINYDLQDYPKSKIQSIQEWPLVLFTFVSAFLTGWMTFTTPDDSLTSKSIFILLLLTGIILSTFHLGKPFRSYRSVLNYKTSWLSREIIFSAFFGLSSFIYLFIYSSDFIKFISLVFGTLLLINIEMVYSVAKKTYNTFVHSSNTLITATMFALVFNQLWKYAVVIVVIKALLYLIRKGSTEINSKQSNVLLVFIRFIIGFIIPIGIMSFTNKNYFSSILFFSLILGELIDRFEFYDCLVINSPQNDMSHVQINRNKT